VSTTVILTPDQEEIRSVARRFLADRYPSERVRELIARGGDDGSGWPEIAELGWAGIALEEARGGAGYGFVERCLLLEEMGRALLPEPYLPSAVLALDAVAAAGTVAAEQLLASIVEGSATATLVAAGDLLGGAPPAGSVRAEADGERYTLEGPAGLVIDGAGAGVLVVAAALPDGTTGLFTADADASGVTRTPVPMVDATRPVAEVSFAGAPARRIDAGDSSTALAGVLDRAAIALAAEMVGGAQRCLELTLEYMHERKQFGVPIGSFQALKHRLADAYVQVESARELVYLAADTVASGDGEGAPLVASAAKAAASEAFVAMAAEAIQLHGGIGFTAEHDAHLFYKRALVSAQVLGTPGVHRERLARCLDG
jgi:alkylation response protein AidB-like acyl-CoA dehydrogenase